MTLSGIGGAIGKRAWNSGFQGAMGKRSNLENNSEEDVEQLAPTGMNQVAQI